MINQNEYQINPLDKIAEIENEMVRDFCQETVENAILMSQENESDAVIKQRLDKLVNITASRLIQKGE